MMPGKPYIILLVAVFAFFASSAGSSAQNIEIQKQKIKRLEEDIKFLDKQIELTQKQHKNTLDELVLIQRKVAGRKKLLAELDNTISIQEKNINSMTENIKTLERRLDTLGFYYNHLIRNAYKNRDSRTWFMYIIASNSIEQGYRRFSYLKNYSGSINKQVAKIRRTKEEIILQKEKLLKLKEENLRLQQAKEKEYKELAKEEQHSRAYSKTLAGKQKEYKIQLAKKKKEAERLNREVERMIAEAIRQEELRKRKEREAAALAHNKKTPPPVSGGNASAVPSEPDVKLSGDFASNKGKLPWPVSRGVIIESFGEHNHPTLPNVKLPFNNGVNISAPGNSPVKAVFGGVVKQIIAMPGYNQCILVKHGGYFTFYCKLDNVLVKVGDNLKSGDILGNLDNNKGTAVLHFELWNGTTKQNPEYWLRKQ